MIEKTTTAEVDGQPACVIQFRYDPHRPYSVVAEFDHGQSWSHTWEFARDVLAAGVHGPAGLADIHIFPVGLREVGMKLTSPDGSLLLHLPRPDVQWFLDRTYEAVPDGSENVDLELDCDLLLLPCDGF